VARRVNLDEIPDVSAGETLDGLNRLAIHPRGQMATGIDGFAIEQHGAGATLAAVATNLCAGKIEMIPQNFRQSPAVFDHHGSRLTVDGQVNGGSRTVSASRGLR
jgi:hypothetical protein